ncbi:MAG TPA: peptidoglycan DD-metalloendopeptidase family protein [Steroidobacteraceae bacterium]|nr:peptidoglycan DD-metalloendopeptidase family protein [Steroidobacteraceae bacterium]
MRRPARDPLARHTRLIGAWLAALLIGSLALGSLSGCGTSPPRPGTHVVREGDTLYSIAWRHGLDYRDVARWNGIGRDYRIYPGQVLRLYPSGGRPSAVVAQSAPAPRPAPARPVAPTPAAGFPWAWPADGAYSVTERPNGAQGLTIAGRLGQAIHAAGPGRVVYTGSGLLGYGQLVIIKHDDVYLSAYGHTASVAVREGDVVQAGQRIATMGEGPGQRAMLYFEIRVHGRPTDPLRFLPARSASLGR